jgi:xanthine dehydrogenase small subunit
MTTKKNKKNTGTPTGKRQEIIFYLNGELNHVATGDGLLTTAEWLRKKAGKTGTKIVCAEGDCGACTILVMNPHRNGGKKEFLPVNSCILTVAQLDGSHIVTIEGIGIDGDLSPVQTQMRNCHGSQCGFCTPGFVMALSGAFESKKCLSAKQAKNCTTGNLCRCTGYEPIIEAATSIEQNERFNLSRRYLPTKSLVLLAKATTQELFFSTPEGTSFYAPKSLKNAISFLAKHKNVKIISGGTDLGVQHNKGRDFPDHLLSLHAIKELYKIKKTGNLLSIGSMVSLEEIRTYSKKILPEFSNLLDVFASPQIKHIATLAGNIANGSPIGDTMPFLLAADAQLKIKGKTGKLREQKLSEFYRGYKILNLKSTELIAAIEVPIDHISTNIKFYKVSQRKDLDISTVSLAIFAPSRHSSQKSKGSSRVALGGVAATPIRLQKLETFLNSHPINPETTQRSASLLQDAIAPISDLRGSEQYRRVVLGHLITNYLTEVSNVGGHP